MTVIVGMPPGRVVCEMPVRIVYENINENVTLPKFAAAS